MPGRAVRRESWSVFVVRPVLRHFALWLLLIPFILVELHIFDLFQQTLMLQDPTRARQTSATILDARAQNDGIDIRYTFQLSGDPTIYTASSLLGSSNSWTPITAQTWQQSSQQHRITVTYLPQNPWINQPDGTQSHPVATSLLTWIVFVLFDLLGLAETFVMVRNFLAAQVAVERRRVERFRFWQSRRLPSPYEQRR